MTKRKMTNGKGHRTGLGCPSCTHCQCHNRVFVVAPPATTLFFLSYYLCHFTFTLYFNHYSHSTGRKNMPHEIIMGGGRRCCYRQGRGRDRRRYYWQGRGKKMQAFKRFAQKGISFTRKHVLPHLAEIGSNVLMDVMEGKNVGQSMKSNARQQARSAMLNEHRRRRQRPRLDR